MALSVSLSGDSEQEIERIKTFLEPSEDQETAAAKLYQIWEQELKVFGKQQKRVSKVTFLKNNEMAFVDIAITREVPLKNAKKKDATEKQYFTMKATWIKSDGEWMQRTKILAK